MIWITVAVFLMILGADDIVQGQNCQAECQMYCGTDGMTRGGSEGRIVNVAYGKPATVSSVFDDTQGTSGPGCMLVNGRTSTAYMTPIQRPLGNANCVSTAIGDFAASWFVDLGRQYTIDNITIFRRGGAQRRMAGLSVLVESETTNQTCYSFPNSSDNTALDALPEQIDITCDPPLTGHKVWLQKHGQDTDGMYYFINLCEVQVWGCKEGFTGVDCRCGHCKYDMTCDVTYMTCPNGCADGWHGTSCNQRQTCQEQCRDNCGTTGLTRDGSGGRIVNVAYGKSATVSSVLTDTQGTSGPGCMLVNGRTSTAYRTPTEGNANCVLTHLGDFAASWFVYLGRQYTIDNITIFRRSGTQRRMAGLSVLVESETTNQTCYSFPNSSDNTALDALPEQMDITCDTRLTGHKVWLKKHGQDRDGMYYFIDVCEVQVWGCKEGYTGVDCRCGHCKYDMTCDVTYMTCPNGCADGWHGTSCNQRCENKWYGSSCEKQCSALCRGDGTCARTSGTCIQGCVLGYAVNGPRCEKCDPGLYGDGCGQTCGQCSGSPCRHESGLCEAGCLDGYQGLGCLVSVTDVGLIAGTTIGGLVLLAVIATLVIVVIWRLRLRSESRATKQIFNTAAAVHQPPEILIDDGNPHEVAEEEEGRVTAAKVDNIYCGLQPPDENGDTYCKLQVQMKGGVLYKKKPQTSRGAV